MQREIEIKHTGEKEMESAQGKLIKKEKTKNSKGGM